MGPGNGGSGSSGTNMPGLIAFGGGPTTIDVRHRVNVSLDNQVVRNVVLSLGVNASGAPPYTFLTGQDNNGDGIFNDRPYPRRQRRCPCLSPEAAPHEIV